MTRAVPEWIGSGPDVAIPMRVRVRVFDRYHGCCQGCLRKLSAGDKWDCDHIVAIVNGGENRESNLRVMCAWCHKRKTAADVAEKSTVYRRKAKHIGAIRRKRTIPGRRFNGEPIPARWK